MKTMGEILIAHGSDKATWHQYHPVYEALFPQRDLVSAVLEIGIETGASLKAWRDIFQNAVVVGLDHNDCSAMNGNRIETHRGNQRDRAAVLRAAGDDRQFDLIVDDASHILSDQLASMFWLWPFLKPGGYYVIEEADIQNGGGPAANLESWPLLKGCELHRTPSPNGEEILVVVRKEKC